MAPQYVNALASTENLVPISGDEKIGKNIAQYRITAATCQPRGFFGFGKKRPSPRAAMSGQIATIRGPNNWSNTVEP
jgi:hypothetical protein